MYLVQKMMTTIVIYVNGIEYEKPLEVIEGQIGACPVFKFYEDAQAYADGAEIIEIRHKQKELLNES